MRLPGATHLASDGWSLLIFPEGERRPGVSIGDFLPGVGLLASRLKVPVIPVHVEGVGRVLPPGGVLPRAAQVQVRFGSPLTFRERDPQVLTDRVEEAVKAL